MKTWTRWLLAILVLALVGGAWWWQHRPAPVQEPTPPAADTPAASAAAAAPPPASAAPAVQHPVEAIQPATAASTPLPSLADSDAAARRGLDALFGREAVLRVLDVDDFVRHVVATVDNLGRARATSRLWPVRPAPGRLLTVERGDGTALADGNAERYSAFATLVGAVDPDRAVALYVHLYPLFQQAYEELGYPGRYFNDRLVQVLDLLLQTPEPAGPLLLTLPEIQGPVPSTRPWVRYQFTDPALESLSAGQKILLRMGPANAAKVKATLKALRERLASRPAPR
jgi:hypothetical protein